MSRVLNRQNRATIATLLAIILMAVSTLLSANSVPMTMSMATDSTTPMTHCHSSAETDNGSMTADHSMTQMQDCQDSDSCQCITLCQITAASDAACPANTFTAHSPGTSTLITTIHAGIHRLPLRPPSLSV